MSEDKKKKYLKQSHSLVEAKYNISNEEMNFILILMSKVWKNDDDFKFSEISFDEYKELTKTEKNFNRFKELGRGILGKYVEIENKKPGKRTWKGITWLSSFEIIENTGIAKVKFSEDMKPYLLNLGEGNPYVKVDLLEKTKLKSFYSKRIYDLLVKYQKYGSYTVEVSKLQEMYNVPKSMLIYSQFKQKVLDVALKEINEKTFLKFNYDVFEKRGKKITKIKFNIKKRQEPKVPELT